MTQPPKPSNFYFNLSRVFGDSIKIRLYCDKQINSTIRPIILCLTHRAMRTKNFLIILCCVVLTSLFLILFSPAGQQNDSFKNIVSQTHQQLKEFHVSYDCWYLSHLLSFSFWPDLCQIYNVYLVTLFE